jgi:hypothetical protein
MAIVAGAALAVHSLVTDLPVGRRLLPLNLRWVCSRVLQSAGREPEDEHDDMVVHFPNPGLMKAVCSAAEGACLPPQPVMFTLCNAFPCEDQCA